jgi:hypothetical protein
MSFLRLPLEIRLHIYSLFPYSLNSRRLVCISAFQSIPQSFSQWGGIIKSSWYFNNSVLLANRQIYQEALPVFYQQCEVFISVHYKEEFLDAVILLRKTPFRFIQSLHLEVVLNADFHENIKSQHGGFHLSQHWFRLLGSTINDMKYLKRQTTIVTSPDEIYLEEYCVLFHERKKIISKLLNLQNHRPTTYIIRSGKILLGQFALATDQQLIACAESMPLGWFLAELVQRQKMTQEIYMERYDRLNEFDVSRFLWKSLPCKKKLQLWAEGLSRQWDGESDILNLDQTQEKLGQPASAVNSLRYKKEHVDLWLAWTRSNNRLQSSLNIRIMPP